MIKVTTTTKKKQETENDMINWEFLPRVVICVNVLEKVQARHNVVSVLREGNIVWRCNTKPNTMGSVNDINESYPTRKFKQSIEFLVARNEALTLLESCQEYMHNGEVIIFLCYS